MSKWLQNNGSHPEELTHKQARALIQQQSLPVSERIALKNHLEWCEDCGRYVAVHIHLSNHLKLEPVRTAIAPRRKFVILDRIRSQQRRAQIMKPVQALTGLAVLVIVVIGAWLAISTLAGNDTTAEVEPPTELPQIMAEESAEEPAEEPTSLPTEIPPSPTALPAEKPAVEPTATLDPLLAYRRYEIGAEIIDFVVADFNQDTFPDIALTDYGQSGTYILLNDGSGDYPEIKTYDTGEGTIAIAADYLNNDSHMDLAIVSDATDRIIVMMGNGDGTFQEPVYYPTTPTPSWVQTGDLNGDSYVDLALAQEPDWVGVMFNNGDGTFGQSEQYNVGEGAGYGSTHVGDLNSDGHLDLAVRHMPSGLVSVLLNNGDGTFGEPVSYEVNYNPMWLVMWDLNQDDNLDLVIPCEGGFVTILYNNGDGSFQDRVDLETGGSTREVDIAELDGDGRPDLIVSPTKSGIVTTFTNNGDGTFSKLEDYYYQGVFLLAIVVTDVEGDGILDLVGVGGGTSVYIIPFEVAQ